MIVEVIHPVPAAARRGRPHRPDAFAQVSTAVALRTADAAEVERISLGKYRIGGMACDLVRVDGALTPDRLAGYLSTPLASVETIGLHDIFHRTPVLAGWHEDGPRQRQAWRSRRVARASRGDPALAPDKAALPAARRALAEALERDWVMAGGHAYRRIVPLVRPRTHGTGIDVDPGHDLDPSLPFPVRPGLLRDLVAHLRPDFPPADDEISRLVEVWPPALVGNDDFLRLACGLPDMILSRVKPAAADDGPLAFLAAHRTRGRLGSIAPDEVSPILLAARDACLAIEAKGVFLQRFGRLIDGFALPAWHAVRASPEDDAALGVLSP